MKVVTKKINYVTYFNVKGGTFVSGNTFTLNQLYMKKYIIYAVIMIFSILPTQLKAASITEPISTSKTLDSPEAQAIMVRLNEIKDQDKSKLSFAEKSALRKEVRQLKSSLSNLNGGVYISVGSIIIVLLLLLLIL